MDNILTVKPDYLGRLNLITAVDLFRELLWAEARKNGIPISKIHVSSRVTVADGGIDAEVDETNITSDLIISGTTGYQIKTGTSFEPWRESIIKKELFGENKPAILQNLGLSIKNILDKNGTYVIVCFGHDLVSTQRTEARSIIYDFLTDCGYENPDIEVWGQTQLIGFISVFPSLVLKLMGRDNLKFQSHTSWAMQDDMRKTFNAGEEQLNFIRKMQDELRKNDKAIHIRVFGEPGIGKTKLVLEATRAEDLSPLILYCSSASIFRDSNLMYELLRTDNQFHVIIVIDECDQDNRSYIWNKFKHYGPRIKIISIFNEFDETTGNITYLEVFKLENEQISLIIQGYGIGEAPSIRFAEICGGSPRYAHLIGNNLRYNPDDIFKPPDTVDIWTKQIIGSDPPDSEKVRKIRIILRHIALFKKFGYEKPAGSEAEEILKLIQKVDPDISWGHFQEIIEELRNRKILQGEFTLYITPKALHIKLWIEWWEIYGKSIKLEEFLKNLSSQLREWFNNMFKYAKESKFSLEKVNEILGENGPFQKDFFFNTSLGAKFFLALTEANPKSALICLNKTIGQMSREELTKFKDGRREIVWALEKIVIWKDLFIGGADILLALAEAENESWSNNATGIFIDLFSPGFGHVSMSEASLEERFPILEKAIESDSKLKREIGFKALNNSLKTGRFSRIVGAEYQGLKMGPKFWVPKNYEEIIDWYSKIWDYLLDKMDYLIEDEKSTVIDILLNNSRNLIIIKELTRKIIETLKFLIEKFEHKRNDILKHIINIIRYENKNLDEITLNELENLKKKIIGNDLHSLLKRYVGLILIEDMIDENGKHIDKKKPILEKLAVDAIKNKEKLIHELEWLTTSEAKDGSRFGYELGIKDENFSLLPKLIETQKKIKPDSSFMFLSGYFRAVFELNQNLWEEKLDNLKENKETIKWIPELTFRTGITDRAALRLLRLLEKGSLEIKDFQNYLLGNVFKVLSEDIVEKWISYLLKLSNKIAINLILNILHFYYLLKKPKKKLPKDITFRVLTSPVLIQMPSNVGYHSLELDWIEIAKEFISLYPDSSIKLADKILENFGKEGTIFDRYNSRTPTILNQITIKSPKEVWEKIIKYIGPPIDSRAFHITKWLRGDEFSEFGIRGALSVIPPQEIWKWIDQNIEERAWYVASFVPKILFRDPDKICLAREVLVRYGNRRDVKDNLIANFLTEGWMGPASVYFQSKKDKLIEFAKSEKNEFVVNWINEYISQIEKDIKNAKFQEERRFP